MTHRMEPAEAFAELGRIKLADTNLQGVLERVAQVAKATLPSAAEVSVTLVHGKRAHTAAFTGDIAIDLDETQYEEGHGPCLTAAASRSTIRVEDMSTESRWPDFAAEAIKRDVTGSMSVGLPIDSQVLGALNIYATRPGPFDDHEVAIAATFAGYAAVAVANANLYDTTATLAQQMQDAMAGRAVIEQAKGVIMALRRCGSDEAFRILAQRSQDNNRKLRDIAAEVVAGANGRAPEPTPANGPAHQRTEVELGGRNRPPSG